MRRVEAVSKLLSLQLSCVRCKEDPEGQVLVLPCAGRILAPTLSEVPCQGGSCWWFDMRLAPANCLDLDSALGNTQEACTRPNR